MISGVTFSAAMVRSHFVFPILIVHYDQDAPVVDLLDGFGNGNKWHSGLIQTIPLDPGGRLPWSGGRFLPIKELVNCSAVHYNRNE
jgi:hypothetical protein